MRITIAQFQVDRNMASNEARVLSVLRAGQPKDLIVFPEGALTGYFPDEEWFPHSIDPDALVGATQRVCSEAARLDVNCIFGAATTFEGVSRNSAIVQTGQGRPGLYHKRQLGRPELSLFEPGTTLPVFGVGDLIVGIQICREIIFPEPWQALKKQGAQLIVHVNNAIKPRDQIWDRLLVARAVENGIFVCSVNNGSPPQALPSFLVAPDGRIVAETNTQQEDIRSARIDPKETIADPDARTDF